MPRARRGHRRADPPRRGRSACPLAKCDGTGWIDAEDGDRRAVRVPERHADPLAGARPGLGDPGALPRRLVRPPAALRHGASARDAHRPRGCRASSPRTSTRGSTAATASGSRARSAPARRRSRWPSPPRRPRRGARVAIYSLPQLLARIRRTYDAAVGEDSYVAFFERLTSVDLLHIDDLGAEKRTDWVLEQLYAIVDERYGAERSMLVTTNLEETELEEQIGGRTVSRLVEMCGELGPLQVEGRDHRY